MKKLAWVQYGRRHNFWGPSAINKNFNVDLHVAYSGKIAASLDLVTQHRYLLHHAIPTVLCKTGINIDVDLKNFFFMNHFHKQVAKALTNTVDVLYTLANGYPLISLADARLKVHDQVACTYELAKLSNQHQSSGYDIERIFEMERKVFAHADVILCPSEHVCRYVKNIQPSAETRLIRYPAQHLFDNRLMIKSDDSYPARRMNALFVGKVCALKGANLVFELARRHPLINFHLAGAVSCDIPTLTNLKIHGHLDRFFLRALFSEADIFVYPSMSEGSAMVCHEAMSFGIPGVVSAQSGSHYVANITGFICDASDIESFSNSIQFFEKNPDQIKAFKQRILDPKINPIITYGVSEYQSLLRDTLCNLV